MMVGKERIHRERSLGVGQLLAKGILQDIVGSGFAAGCNRVEGLGFRVHFLIDVTGFRV